MALYGWNVVILCFSWYFDISSGALDASAILLECKKGSSKDDLKRIFPPYHTIDNCTRKIRITLNITNKGKTPQDLDYSVLTQLSDPETGSNMYLLNPVVLRLRQDQVLLAYPFNYLSAVNGKATEIVINYQNRRNFTGCDDTSQINPTCGLKHDRGKAVPFSEGFCCFCPEAPVRQKQTRGGQDCSLDVGNPSDVEKQKYKASAHCLQLSDIWYSVSAVSEPFILHETFMQVYTQKHLKNGSSVWVALTHNEDFELGSKNPFQYDENKTILISYMTSNPKSKSFIPIEDRRLLIPQPMPSVELSKLPVPVKNGARDYLLLPKSIINPDGDDCDVAGVSYEAFVQQPNRCNIGKDTCLKNQPLDFWEKDDGKRKSGAKGAYLLENFGIPYKDPIIVHPETKEHWLALEYIDPHLTVLMVEINADEMPIMSVGKYVQISKVMTSASTQAINFYVSILNTGLMPAKFKVQVVKCAFGVGDSTNESSIIPPQMTQDVIIATKPGSISLNEEFTCTVQVSNGLYGVVAYREVKIDPLSRCICNFYCKCACLRGSLKCEPLSEEDHLAAGFRGSIPILIAKPPYRLWILKHPFLALLSFILFLLLFGFIKGILGLAGFGRVGRFGMDRFLYQPKKIKSYLQLDLRNVKVVYDAEGYPINPDTKERVRVIGDELLFGFNLLFLFFWPCMKVRWCVSKVAERKKKIQKKRAIDKDKESDNFLKKLIRGKGSGPPKDRSSPDLEQDKGQRKEKHKDLSPELKSGNQREERGGIHEHRRSLSFNDLEEPLTTGPIADPLNKERERWTKGQKRIQAVTK